MFRNLDKLEKQLESVQTEINRLSGFRDTPQLRKFRRQLEGEKSEIKARISKLTETLDQKTTEQQKVRERANHNRRSKMTRYWNYLKAIQANYFPDMSLKEIRKQHRMHKDGLESSVSDVAWRNPSP